jgi:thymidylate synthase
MRNFQSNTADNLWLQVVKTLQSQSHSEIIPSRLGNMLELLHVGITISEPRQRWIISRVPALNPAFGLAEIIWIMNGSNEAEIVNYWNPALPKYAGYTNRYHGAYGYRLRNHFHFDQLEKAYYSLQKNGYSRQVVLQIWDPNADFPNQDGNPVADDIPCNLSSLLKIRKNKLEWMQINRSNDIYRGLPYNLIQFTTLQELMASWLGIEIGSYNHLSDSLHLYTKDLNDLGYSSVDYNCTNTDKFQLNYSDSQIYFKIIFEKMNFIIKNRLSEKDYFSYFNDIFKIESLDNMLRIIGADAARRVNYFDVSSELIDNCTNPVYKVLWKNWSARQDAKVTSYSFI